MLNADESKTSYNGGSILRNVKATPVSAGSFGESFSSGSTYNQTNRGFNYQLLVTNRTNTTLRVTMRDGMELTIPPTETRPNDIVTGIGLYIRKEYGFNTKATIKFNNLNVNTQINTSEADELFRLVRRYEETKDQLHLHSGSGFSLDYFIPAVDLFSTGRAVFVQELDMLVESAAINTGAVHPQRNNFALDDLVNSFYKDIPYPCNGFGMFMVDRKGTRANRYLKVGPTVIQVPNVLTIPNLDDGFYYYSNKATEGLGSLGDNSFLRMSIDEATERFHLMHSVEEATKLDQLEVNKLKLKSLEVEARTNTAKVDLVAMRGDQEKVKYDNEEKKRAFEDISREYQSRKDSRNEVLEWAKLGLGLVSTGLLIYNLISSKK